MHELFVMEPTNHILEWLRMDNDTAIKIEETCPSWIFGNDLKIYYTSMIPDAHATTWLRNSLYVKLPDNTLLLHLKDTIPVSQFSSTLDELMDGYTWVPTFPGSGYMDMRRKIGIFRDFYERPQFSSNVMHIIFGSFMVHLVAEEGEGTFHRFAECCRNEGHGLTIYAGCTRIGSKHTVNTTSPPVRKCHLVTQHGGSTEMGKTLVQPVHL